MITTTHAVVSVHAALSLSPSRAVFPYGRIRDGERKQKLNKWHLNADMTPWPL